MSIGASRNTQLHSEKLPGRRIWLATHEANVGDKCSNGKFLPYPGRLHLLAEVILPISTFVAFFL